MNYLLLLAVGLGVIWGGIALKDEVYQITAAIVGTFFLVWGFASTPAPLQMIVEVVAVLSVFSICISCWEK